MVCLERQRRGEATLTAPSAAPTQVPANTPKCGAAHGHQHTLTRVDKVCKTISKQNLEFFVPCLF